MADAADQSLEAVSAVGVEGAGGVEPAGGAAAAGVEHVGAVGADELAHDGERLERGQLPEQQVGGGAGGEHPIVRREGHRLDRAAGDAVAQRGGDEADEPTRVGAPQCEAAAPGEGERHGAAVVGEGRVGGEAVGALAELHRLAAIEVPHRGRLGEVGCQQAAAVGAPAQVVVGGGGHGQHRQGPAGGELADPDGWLASRRGGQQASRGVEGHRHEPPAPGIDGAEALSVGQAPEPHRADVVAGSHQRGGPVEGGGVDGLAELGRGHVTVEPGHHRARVDREDLHRLAGALRHVAPVRRDGLDHQPEEGPLPRCEGGQGPAGAEIPGPQPMAVAVAC